MGDHRGKYEDGAFYAAPDLQDEEENWEADQDLQKPYLDSILTRFQALRQQIQRKPPPEAVQTLGDDRPTHVAYLNAERVKFWRWKMRAVDPHAIQIASMDKETVLRLLEVLTGGTFLKTGKEIEIGVSGWIWSLLARLPERGELNSEEIGVVRELGKKAVLVGVGLKAEKSWEEGIQAVEAGYDDNTEDQGAHGFVAAADDEPLLELEEEPLYDEHLSRQGEALPTTNSNEFGANQDIQKRRPELEPATTPHIETDVTGSGALATETQEFLAAKSRILNALSKETMEINIEPPIKSPATSTQQISEVSEDRLNTKATIDMIVTVAGEVYGQRDLLEFRAQWSDL